MKKINNYKIIIATIISFIFLIYSSFFVAFSSVKAREIEPKRQLITPQNSYSELLILTDEDQMNTQVTSTLSITYLFDTEDMSVYGLIFEVYHIEYFNGEVVNEIVFDDTLNVVFDLPLVIGAENNNPYISIEYSCRRYQTSNYYIPYYGIYYGNDNYEISIEANTTSFNGAFYTSHTLYYPKQILSYIYNDSYKIAYTLFSDSFENGYETGKNEGYNQGYLNGKADGYGEGYADGSDGSFSPSWLSALFSSLDAIFQVEIFPNFKLWYLIGAPLMVALVIAVLKFLR